MVQDMKDRQRLARVDDDSRRYNVGKAREFIYEQNFGVTSKAVENLLKGQSLVPTEVRITSNQSNETNALLQNAFSKRLGHLGFDMYHMFVVDLLHEFELGIWKAVFTHLIRILYATDKSLVHELDRRYVNSYYRNVTQSLTTLRRYRQMPTFGGDTIRRFSSNVSEMKKMAARDYADLLQVCSSLFRACVSPTNTKTSALYPLLMAFYRSRTTAM